MVIKKGQDFIITPGLWDCLLKIRFKRSGLYISLIPPYLVGFFVGILSSIMGVGGGFIIIPAMIYILRMPTSVVVGTSLYQIIFITAFVTILHASTIIQLI